MTAVYKVRRTLVDVLADVVPADVEVDFGPASDQRKTGRYVWLGVSTDADQEQRAISGPGRKSAETFEVPLRLWVGGEATQREAEAALEDIHCSIEEWLDAHPRLYDTSDVIEGTPVVPVPELEWAQISRFEVDNGWDSTSGPLAVAELTIRCKARGGMA